MNHKVSIAAAVLLVACEQGVDDQSTQGAGAGSGAGSPTGAQSTGASGSTGATSQAQQPFTAGSRLKVRTLTSEDGAKQQLGFIDTSLDVACAFARATDGTQRCMPIDAADAGEYFKDSECTVPVAVRACSSIPKYARGSAGGCPEEVEIRTVSGAFAGLVYARALGTCGQAMLGSLSAFDLGPAVPPSTWAQATESVE